MRAFSMPVILSLCACLIAVGGCDDSSASTPKEFQAKTLDLMQYCIVQPENVADGAEIDYKNGEFASEIGEVTGVDRANDILYRGEVYARLPVRAKGSSDAWHTDIITFVAIATKDAIKVRPNPWASRISSLALEKWFCEVHKGETFKETYQNHLKAPAK